MRHHYWQSSMFCTHFKQHLELMPVDAWLISISAVQGSDESLSATVLHVALKSVVIRSTCKGNAIVSALPLHSRVQRNVIFAALSHGNFRISTLWSLTQSRLVLVPLTGRPEVVVSPHNALFAVFTLFMTSTVCWNSSSSQVILFDQPDLAL